MIISCPSCSTRFRVEATVLRRLVRCANCGHTWRHVTQAAPPLRAEPKAAPPLRTEPAAPTAAAAPDLPPLDAEARVPVPPVAEPRRSHAGAIAAVVILLMIAAGAVLAAVVERQAIVARYPSAAPLFATLGLPVERSAAALKIDKIKPMRTAEGLIIEGEVSNAGKAAHELPRLRVALQDAADKEVQFKIIPPPKIRLEPGEVAHFKTPFEHPADAAKNVVVTFALR
jgi:predicted Zn finger-like uncharacterized protein